MMLRLLEVSSRIRGTYQDRACIETLYSRTMLYRPSGAGVEVYTRDRSKLGVPAGCISRSGKADCCCMLQLWRSRGLIRMGRSDLDPPVGGSSAVLMEISSLVRHPAGSHSVIEEGELLAHLRCGTTPTVHHAGHVRVVGKASRYSSDASSMRFGGHVDVGV